MNKEPILPVINPYLWWTNERIESLLKYGIQVLDNQGIFIGWLEIIEEVCQIWFDLNRTERLFLCNHLVGNRNGETLYRLIDQMSRIKFCM